MSGDERAVDHARFRRASVMSGIADGIVATALPLVATSITRDPVSVAGVVAVQHLPWPVVALLGPRLLAGADRRTLIGAVDTVRALLLGALGLRVVTGSASFSLVLAVGLVVGLGEALTDLSEVDAAHQLDPGAGRRPGLGLGGMIGLGLVGLPLGGVLYELAAALPLLLDVGAFALAALFALSARRGVRASGTGRRGGVLIVDRPPAGTSVVVAVAVLVSATTSAVLGVLALFALDELGLGAPAFGLLLAGLAVSSAAGGFAAPIVGEILGRRFGLAAAAAGTGLALGAAGLLADPATPYSSVVALGVAAGTAMVVAVLVRAAMRAAAAAGAEAAVFETLHLAVWTAIPVGALLGGFAGRALGIREVVTGAGGVALLAAVAAVAAAPTTRTAATRTAGTTTDRPPLEERADFSSYSVDVSSAAVVPSRVYESRGR